MCGSPNIPDAPKPPPEPPKKKVELNPERKKSADLKRKNQGTRNLQIPLASGAPKSGAGLSIPGRSK